MQFRGLFLARGYSTPTSSVSFHVQGPLLGRQSRPLGTPSPPPLQGKYSDHSEQASILATGTGASAAICFLLSGSQMPAGSAISVPGSVPWEQALLSYGEAEESIAPVIWYVSLSKCGVPC